MGLDVVEFVLQCEESLAVELEDYRLERVRTVGDLFELICEKLILPSGADQPRPVARTYVPRVIAPTEGWTRDTAWFHLVRICVDQLQVTEEEVKYGASFSNDLGAD